MSELRVPRLDRRAKLPTRAYPGDAGLDLYALDGAALGPGERASLRTGIAVEIPDGQAGLVLPRSGLAARHGIALVNAPGLIDAGYRGEIRVLLLNTDRDSAFDDRAPATGSRSSCSCGSRRPAVLEVDELALSERGDGRVRLERQPDRATGSRSDVRGDQPVRLQELLGDDRRDPGSETSTAAFSRRITGVRQQRLTRLIVAANAGPSAGQHLGRDDRARRCPSRTTCAGRAAACSRRAASWPSVVFTSAACTAPWSSA